MILPSIQDIWKDPVWSKVIATGLIFVLSQSIILIWSLIANIPFFDVYKKFKPWHKSKISIKKTIKPNPTKLDKQPEIITEASTVFFHYRICEAFPGVNYLNWIETPKDVIKRLDILLRAPTKFKKVLGENTTSDPIWWFRGDEALYIESFKILSKNKCLINYEEYIIEKIAIYRGSSYFRDFVYVQCKPDKPIGLYHHDKKFIQEHYEEYGSCTEEYGLYKKRPITRGEYDDGAANIRGKIVNVIGKTELRVRSLIKYNFIIAAKFSPYNCNEFNYKSLKFFKDILEEKTTLEDFIKWTKSLFKFHLEIRLTINRIMDNWIKAIPDSGNLS